MLPAPPVMDDRPLSADRVPTLTEVVELDLPGQPPIGVDADAPPSAATAAMPPAPVARDEAPAMADDFVLSGLETDEGHANGEAGAAASPMVSFEGSMRPSGDADEAGAAPVEAEGAPVANAPGPDKPEAAPERPAPPTLAAAIEAPAPGPLPGVDVDAVASQVLSELLPRIDMLLESRLREALAPALARAADGLIRDTRTNLAVAVRDLVREAVDRALQRRADL